ncbi:MAG: MFS transporter [Thermoflexales bacterium]|nr:MFS transporter [Thermoflexales bacterium]MCS7324707.1 MFS transporter [Thermoflexales bacterium]MDW8054080.1 MFS transporter [Anaerolineae bacterium]MDW8292585.1 MFS transporter [Anaerolineae bacterium]
MRLQLELSPTAKFYAVWLAIFSFTMSFATTLVNFYLDARGLDKAAIGVFHAASQVGGLIVLLPALLLFRRLGRRGALVFGAAWAALMRIITVLPLPLPLVLLAEGASGLGSVLYGLAGVSLLADATTRRNRARVFGAVEGIRTVLMFVGSVMAGIGPEIASAVMRLDARSAESYRAVLLFAFGVRLAGTVALLRLVRAPDNATALPEVNPMRYMNLRVLLAQRRGLYALAAPFAALWLAESLFVTFVTLFLREQLGLSDAAVGGVVGGGTLLGALGALLIPWLAQRWGEQRVLRALMLAAALALAALAHSSAPLLGSGLVLAFSATFQGIAVSYRALATNLARRDEHFILSVILAAAGNLGPTFGPLLGGWVLAHYSFGALFTLAAGLMLAALLLLTAALPLLRSPAPLQHSTLLPAQRPQIQRE